MKPRQPVNPRLRDLAYEFLEPYSQHFLAQSGLTEGMRVLEIGCGAGAMTPWLSRNIGTSGRLVALDINTQQIERARQKVMESGLDNTDFIAASVEKDLTIGLNFDFIYGRFILMQLQDPFGVLTRLVSYLRPGGVIALDEPNQEADFANPPCPPCEHANRLFLEYADRHGLNFRIGDSLYSMLLRLGVQIKVSHTCQPIFPLSLATQMFKHGLLDSLSPLLQANVTNALSIETILDELERWPANDTAFYALSRQVQVSGVKL